MRLSLPTLLSSVLLAAIVPAGAAPTATPVIGCASLANLRFLLKQAGNDPAAAAAVLSDDKADHLGCSVLGREAVTAVLDHAALNGAAYDCVTVRTTSVCQWTLAGSVVPFEPSRPGRRSAQEGGKATPGKGVQDKGVQDKTSQDKTTQDRAPR